MEIVTRKEGYGYLLKWVVRLGDLLLINLFFISLYLLCNSIISEGAFDAHGIIESFLLINLSYFITLSFVSIEVSSNIVFFDKILQRSVGFITLYTIILTVGFSLFGGLSFGLLSWCVIYLVLGLLYASWHIVFRLALKFYRRKGHNFKKIVIIGKGLNGQNLYDEISSHDYGYKILGFFDDDILTNSEEPDYLGTISKVEDFCLKNGVDEMYCTLPGNQEVKTIQLLNFSEKHMIRFYLVPEFYKYIKRRLVLNFLQSMPVVGIRREPLQLFSNRMIKRGFDLIFSLTVLFTIFPILYIVLGAIIKLTSRGPVIFKQSRTGLEGKTFNCYKFRSMTINREADMLTATRGDRRVTAIGKFMRKTSLDEMPQFLNVVMGNMSVVGPRPHMIQQTKLYSKFIDKFMVRHLVKPGITGWAQISGYRGETKTIGQMEGRFKKDIWYLENWSFFLDIKIIIVTVLNVFKGEENAY